MAKKRNALVLLFSTPSLSRARSPAATRLGTPLLRHDSQALTSLACSRRSAGVVSARIMERGTQEEACFFWGGGRAEVSFFFFLKVRESEKRGK